MTTSRWLKLSEAAEYLRCSERHFRRHVLPYLMPVENGRILLFTTEELDAWADRARGAAGHQASTRLAVAERTGAPQLAAAGGARGDLQDPRAPLAGRERGRRAESAGEGVLTSTGTVSGTAEPVETAQVEMTGGSGRADHCDGEQCVTGTTAERPAHRTSVHHAEGT